MGAVQVCMGGIIVAQEQSLELRVVGSGAWCVLGGTMVGCVWVACIAGQSLVVVLVCMAELVVWGEVKLAVCAYNSGEAAVAT